MEIEPKILPLVDAINELSIVRTFSSCEAHYDEQDQEFMDRNKADVRFDPLPGVALEEIEVFITYLMTEFNNLHGFTPMTLTGYKLFMPNDDYQPEFTFVIELEPFDRFDTAKNKRKGTDKAIAQATEIVKKYKGRK